MTDIQTLYDRIDRLLGDDIADQTIYCDEITIDVAADKLIDVCQRLRNESSLDFEQLMDVCGIDYGRYGQDADDTLNQDIEEEKRFAVIYHLLSVSQNHRLRIRVTVDNDLLTVPSVIDIWRVADWFERETFDMFGIMFEGHPDLRRILSDYGFLGHPLRKDFPLIGHVEMRYDPEKGRVIYQPVSIEPRTLVPRIIREDGFGV